MFWILWSNGKTWKKYHFDFLNSTNCDTETIIWLSTKINKLYYLSFCSFDLKSEDMIWKYNDQENSRWKTQFNIFCLTPSKLVVTLCPPWGIYWCPWPQRNVSNMGFHFSQNSSIFFQISINVIFWLFKLEKYALELKYMFWVQMRKKLSHEEECVILTDQFSWFSYFT